MKNKMLIALLFFTMILGSLSIYSCSAISYTKQAPDINEEAVVIEDDKILIDLERAIELKKIGGSVLVEKSPDQYLIIAHTDEDQYVVASSHCTHRGMALGYDQDTKTFRCSSFGKREFNLDGSVVDGSEEDALMIYNSSLEDNILTIDIEHDKSESKN
mgnify:CR=1 FL=1